METGKANPEAKNQFAKALFYEFLGSIIITLSFTLSYKTGFIRGIAFFIAYIIAVQTSGAHFNPATTLAVFMQEKKYKQHVKYLLYCMVVQVCGALASLLIVWLLVKNHDSSSITLYPSGKLYTYTELRTTGESIFFGRVVLQEILQTFTFTLIYLMFKYEKYFQKGNKLIQGMALAHVFSACCSLSSGSGSCFNPALSIAQTIYMVSMGVQDYNCIWVYLIMPFVGGVIAQLFFDFHIKVSEGVNKDPDDSIATHRSKSIGGDE